MRPRRTSQKIQIDQKGRVVRIVEQITSKRVIKTSVADAHGSVDMPFIPGTGGHYPQTAGRGESGLIDPAIANTNVLNRLKGTKRITMIITGQDPKGRVRTFTKELLTRNVKSLRKMMVTGVLEALRDKGFRTQYRLSQVDWRGLVPDYTRGGNRSNSFNNVRGRTPLDHLDIQITLHK